MLAWVLHDILIALTSQYNTTWRCQRAVALLNKRKFAECLHDPTSRPINQTHLNNFSYHFQDRIRIPDFLTLLWILVTLREINTGICPGIAGPCLLLSIPLLCCARLTSFWCSASSNLFLFEPEHKLYLCLDWFTVSSTNSTLFKLLLLVAVTLYLWAVTSGIEWHLTRKGRLFFWRFILLFLESLSKRSSKLLGESNLIYSPYVEFQKVIVTSAMEDCRWSRVFWRSGTWNLRKEESKASGGWLLLK